MNILGIESSCDETSAAIVQDGMRVLSNIIASQIDMHKLTGGVVPEAAAREHVKHMVPVLQEALDAAHLGWEEIDAIAVTKGPGLIGSLVTGVAAANTLSLLYDKPLIAVNHVEGHFVANFLDCEEEPQFPLLVLSVSGGHNELVLMHSALDYEILGETLDDAAGEAFDKVARLLGLPYPGGPSISKAAMTGDRNFHTFPKARLEKGSLDFSFSGLKTSVLYFIQKELPAYQDDVSKLNAFVADTAACFQDAVVGILIDKLLMALEISPAVREVHLTGGVSANTRLREVAAERLSHSFPHIILRYPKKLSYCTDNAAMIAARGFFQYSKNAQNDFPIAPTPHFW